MSWASGNDRWIEHAGEGCSTVVVEDPQHLGPLLETDLVAEGTVVFANDVSSVPADRCLVVPFEGTVAEPGHDLSIADDLFIETQDYASTSFGVLMGHTFLRITSEVDFEAYLDDADTAFQTGAFNQSLTNPEALLADRVALGSGQVGDGPGTRLFVDKEGLISVGPYAAPLGSVEDARLHNVQQQWDLLGASCCHPGTPALAGALGGLDGSDPRWSRDWLSRYLVAVDAIHHLTVRGAVQPQVSGFGGYFMEELSEIPVTERPDLPVLLRDESRAYLYFAPTNRVVSFSLSAAGIAEALLVCGTIELAANYVNRAKLTELHQGLVSADTPIDLSWADA